MAGAANLSKAGFAFGIPCFTSLIIRLSRSNAPCKIEHVVSDDTSPHVAVANFPVPLTISKLVISSFVCLLYSLKQAMQRNTVKTDSIYRKKYLKIDFPTHAF